MAGIPSVYPLFLFASAGASGGDTILAGPVTVTLPDESISVTPADEQITVTVFPSSIVAGS